MPGPDEAQPLTVASAPAGEEDADGRRIGRRAVLGMLGLGGAGVLVGSRVQGAISDLLRPITLRDTTGLTSYLPGSERFRIYSVTGSMPAAPVPYELKISGLVDNPYTVGLEELTEDLPQVSMTKDFQCVTGWRVEDVPWRGVLLSNLLARAGVQPEAVSVKFTSFDGVYTESLTLAQARRDDVLVAHHMLGAPVTRDHGGPVRLYVAPMYGYKSIKWLDGIELMDHTELGYWEERGYDDDAWIGKSNSRSYDEPA